MIVRKLNQEETAQLRQLAADRHLFLFSEWIDTLGNVEVAGIFSKDDQLKGGFVFTPTQLKKLSAITDPIFTPHISLFLTGKPESNARRNKLEKEVAEAIIKFLEEQKKKIIHIHLPPSFEFVQPFIWSEYQVNPRFTYRIDLSKTEEELKGEMSPDMRNLIRKSDAEEYVVIENPDVSESAKAVLATLNQNEVGIDLSSVENLMRRLVDAGKGFIQCVEKQGVGRSYAFCAHDSSDCYYLFGAGPTGQRDGAAGRINLWNAILRAKERGISTFDFEGSMIPEIERFFRGFGGELVTYQGISKMPAWVRTAANISGKKFI